MKKPMPQSPEQSLVATLQEPAPQSLESIFKEYIEATCQGDTDAQRVFAMMLFRMLADHSYRSPIAHFRSNRPIPSIPKRSWVHSDPYASTSVCFSATVAVFIFWPVDCIR